jgi:hypothetical protein
MKIKSLHLSTHLMKYRKHCLTSVIAWEPYWKELFTICTRSSKDQSIACEGLNMKLFEALSSFLHEARQYFSSPDPSSPDPSSTLTTTAAAQEILKEGMNLLQDLRNPLCFFGLQMLVLLLPTALSSSFYDEILPTWVELFALISDNEAWDCCFLTLFCRARKYSSSFNWMTLLPLLQVKTKGLLQFPVTKGRSDFLFAPLCLLLDFSLPLSTDTIPSPSPSCWPTTSPNSPLPYWPPFLLTLLPPSLAPS